MNLSFYLEQYWPLLLLALWFGYKWWNTRRVIGLLPRLRDQGAVVVDVRSPEEFAGGHAPGAVNIPLNELGSRLQEIPNTAPVVLCCASGTRSGMARMMLRKKGYGQVFNIGKWTHLLR
ncbi:MAG: rhodanese-like domain-containing protein [Burkholderiales bacterium]|nr:MAG: rhodanese-like domain-containing protein [Burkholderiales bacterium]